MWVSSLQTLPNLADIFIAVLSLCVPCALLAVPAHPPWEVCRAVCTLRPGGVSRLASSATTHSAESSAIYRSSGTKCGDRVRETARPITRRARVRRSCPDFGAWWWPVLCAPWEPEQWSSRRDASCLTARNVSAWIHWMPASRAPHARSRASAPARERWTAELELMVIVDSAGKAALLAQEVEADCAGAPDGGWQAWWRRAGGGKAQRGDGARDSAQTGLRGV